MQHDLQKADGHSRCKADEYHRWQTRATTRASAQGATPMRSQVVSDFWGSIGLLGCSSHHVRCWAGAFSAKSIDLP
jgi:hypothetical protein